MMLCWLVSIIVENLHALRRSRRFLTCLAINICFGRSFPSTLHQFASVIQAIVGFHTNYFWFGAE